MREPKYRVKEIFRSLQGEGAQTGAPAVFLRFSGCNLWSGREEDRKSAKCKFCDTQFLDGEEMSLGQVLGTIHHLFGHTHHHRLVVATGGEPTLQLDTHLVNGLHKNNARIALETNGTLEIPDGVDWVTVSPKAGTKIRQRWGNELKVVWPQPLDLNALGELDFDYFYLQPMAGENYEDNVSLAIQACLDNPRWRLSTQIHKTLGLP